MPSMRLSGSRRCAAGYLLHKLHDSGRWRLFLNTRQWTICEPVHRSMRFRKFCTKDAKRRQKSSSGYAENN